MERYGKTAIWLMFLMVFSLLAPPPTTAFDEGPIDPSLIPSSFPVEVTLKFWGFSSDLIWQSLRFPPRIVIETFNEQNDQLMQYFEVIFGYPFAWQAEISYNIQINPAPIEDLVSFFNTNSSSMAGYPAKINGTFQTVTGRGLPVEEMAGFLRQYDEEEGYTLHIIDGSIFQSTPDSFHWYFVSSEKDYYAGMGDFRNLGAISPTSLFYDVNAFTPQFLDLPDGSQRMIDAVNTTYTVNNFIQDRIKSLIEKIILGSPYSRRFGFVSYSTIQRLHFSKIVVGGNNSLTETYQIHTKTGENGFSNILQSFFSFYPKPIEIKEDYTFLNDNSRLRAFIENHVQLINGTRSIVMDSRQGEELKNAIRTDKSIYSAFPSGFFYLTY